MRFRLILFSLLFATLHLQAMPVEKTKVDSICEYLSGTWHKTLDYNGFTGKVRPIYSGDTIILERITGTDSLIWSKMKSGILINYMKTKIAVSPEEYKEWELYTSIGLIGYLDTDETGFFFQYEGSDAGGYGYSRIQLVSSVTDPSAATEIQVYPNPSNGWVQLSEAFQGRVQILDATGRVLYQNHTPTPIRSVDLSPYPNGIYFLRLEKEGKPILLKVIKK